MREAGCTGGTVSLTVRYADFSTFSRQHRGHGDLRTGYEVYRSAYALFEKLLPLRQSVRLLGVSISGIQKDDRQRFLFQDMERRVKLAEVVDEVNRKYGGAVLKPSSILIAERFGIERPCAVMGKYMFKKK
jgi:DNA polymerase-4